MKNTFSIGIGLALGAGLLAGKCKRPDPIVPNEEELITTMIYALTPADTGPPVLLSFRDLDGEGGNPPVYSSAALRQNAGYAGRIILLNESVSPADTISREVLDEGTAHQFFFSSSIPSLNIEYADRDASGRPIGLRSIVSTGLAGAGKLTITLRHQPNKGASGVAEGNIQNAGGETDIEVNFDVAVE